MYAGRHGFQVTRPQRLGLFLFTDSCLFSSDCVVHIQSLTSSPYCWKIWEIAEIMTLGRIYFGGT